MEVLLVISYIPVQINLVRALTLLTSSFFHPCVLPFVCDFGQGDNPISRQNLQIVQVNDLIAYVYTTYDH